MIEFSSSSYKIINSRDIVECEILVLLKLFV